MSGTSPASVLFSTDGYELAVVPNTAIPAGTRSILTSGSDGTNSRPIAVDSSGRPIVVGAGTAGTPVGGVVTIQGIAGGQAIPVSGSITATNASVGATGSTVPSSASLAGATVITSAPTLTAGNLSSLYTTAAGRLIIDGSQVTQPVSGTITANAGTGTFNVAGTGTAGTANAGVVTIQGIAGMTAVTVSGTVTANAGTGNFNNASVSTTAATPPGSATYMGGSVTTAAPTYTTGQMNALSLTTAGALRIDGSGTTQPVSGTVTANAGTGNFNNASVSATGAAPPASATYFGGSVTTAAPTYTTGQMSALSLTTGGLLRVDGSGTTQPVSGTITANIGTTGGLALDATLTGNNQRTRITDGTNLAAVKAASTAPVAADPAFVVAISPNTPALKVITDSSSTSSVTSVAASTTSVSLLAANTNRVLATIYNDANKTLYVKLGATASTTSFTIQIFQNSYWELPASYTGAIDGIWASGASGNARITELS